MRVICSMNDVTTEDIVIECGRSWRQQCLQGMLLCGCQHNSAMQLRPSQSNEGEVDKVSLNSMCNQNVLRPACIS